MIARDVPSLRQLRAFEAVARCQGISRAAKEISLSQPGVSQAIRELEAQLNARLFERRHSGCYGTELGLILLPRVRRLLDHLASALRAFDSGTPQDGRQNANAIIKKLTRPQLRSLIAISENESFDAAARSLNISEPSLHRAARGLERELRRTLYRRTARGVTTTHQAPISHRAVRSRCARSRTAWTNSRRHEATSSRGLRSAIFRTPPLRSCRML